MVVIVIVLTVIIRIVIIATVNIAIVIVAASVGSMPLCHIGGFWPSGVFGFRA